MNITLAEKPLRVADDHFLLKIRHEGAAPLPGQFVNIRVAASFDPLIRRPFSVFDRIEGGYSIVVRVVGRGTKALSELALGPMDILGPMGRGFTILDGGSALLVGGGVGCAPLFFLARELKARGVRVAMLFGASRAGYVFCADEFRGMCDEFSVWTDDGSMGSKGLVTAGMAAALAGKSFDRVYACGPEPMMRAAVAGAGRVPIEVSLENYFGCGIGLCVGCSLETVGGLKRACVDGPVFDGREVVWESLAR